MKKYPIMFLLSWLLHSAFAQNYVDIARLHFYSSSLNKFENAPTKTRVNEMGLDITYPITLKNNDAVLTGLAYEGIGVRLADDENYQSISSIAFRIGLNKKHSEKWSGTYVLIPKLASDFEQWSGRNFQLGALALLRFTKHDQLNYKVGLYINSDLFGPFTVPLLGLYYLSPSKNFEANMVLPQNMDLNYKLHKIVTVGINFTSQIRSFRLSQIISTAQPGYVVKSTNELCGYLKFNLTKNLSFQTRVGYTIGRNYRVFDEKDKIDWAIMFVKFGDDRTQLNTRFADGFIGQGILLWRFIRE
jgi:Domain of unknown function (DUF6268)